VPQRLEVVPLQCTSLEAGTNVVVPGLRRVDINHEAWSHAADLKRRSSHLHTPTWLYSPPGRVRLARDLTSSTRTSLAGHAAPGRRAVFEDNRHRMMDAHANCDSDSSPWAVPGNLADGTANRCNPPTCVDWSSDLLFICSTSSEHAFQSLQDQSWADRIQHLAVLVPARSVTPIPFGPEYLVSQALQPMAALRAVYMVMIPRTPPACGALGALRRDRFGFVGYVEYLQAVGATTDEMMRGRHLTYQRTTLSFQQALTRHLGRAGVALRKVVDVDCCSFTENEYRRRGKRSGMKGS
jgi:hypothetical protein